MTPCYKWCAPKTKSTDLNTREMDLVNVFFFPPMCRLWAEPETGRLRRHTSALEGFNEKHAGASPVWNHEQAVSRLVIRAPKPKMMSSDSIFSAVTQRKLLKIIWLIVRISCIESLTFVAVQENIICHVCLCSRVLHCPFYEDSSIMVWDSVQSSICAQVQSRGRSVWDHCSLGFMKTVIPFTGNISVSSVSTTTWNENKCCRVCKITRTLMFWWVSHSVYIRKKQTVYHILARFHNSD